MRTTLVHGAIELALLLAAVSFASAENSNWPNCLGPNRNSISPDPTPLADSWPAGGPRELWSHKLNAGHGGEGSVATKDGIVSTDYHPESHGFDSNVGGCALGQPKSRSDPYRNATIENRKKGEYLTHRLGDEAAAFIEANQEGTFHLSLWPYSVHTPIKALREVVK